MARINAVTLRQLRVLRAVIDSGSLTGAAGLLSLSPPAIHSQLRALEDLLGAPMVIRGEHGAFLATEEGRAVLEAEAQIAIALETCARRVAALQSGHTGNVSLGVVSTGKYFAPRLVADLRRALPEVEVTLRIGNRDAVIQWLTSRALDLAIMGRPPRSPAVLAEPIGPHPHIIVAPPDHPLAAADPALPQDLLAETYLAREPGSGTRILMTRFLDRIGDGTPWRMVEMGTNETIKQAVIAGLGIALISQHTVTEELRAGRLVALKAAGLPIQRNWFIIRREDMALSPAGQRVHDHVLALNGAFLPAVES
ncbi:MULTISPECIES: LysR family regulator CbbR [Paracoccus]|jgi:DNA-binding transcriptional LysR family regulator|uniref:HTH-type transcriptional regulator CbbR n=1 Tax=Paracoccus denitrificans (strain Pd 1222) TaxID=318586 RepID=A1B2P7_PARDP|nr:MULTISPECIES: LysR substrate-binding domain-containing protein [Paracoccus]ABL69791.1 transcriptional regulator, LysR family [Paracoccus denitrificans PD1222]MBB4629397.1 DNA-binding transcriptional LysR family regulator [Paracoccus denitrificans]MCU7431564.1 LysR substrate-binding domain-containing protein [Paracoccus denitrificans]MDK8874901.1 LysR substrate-binding domain-containing protein [Paracoccus sp. SSJ]QAR25197.1 LysR family transcriptional regulator [Paracoccus denitrificans]